MASGPLLQSKAYRIACACSLALVVYVVARAPLWNPVMAGARARVGSGSVALVPAAWQCSDRPHVCSTIVAGEELVARVGAAGDHPISCSASFRGQAVTCGAQLWYAPRLKPFLEIGELPRVSVEEALLERPWRILDLGLLGEQGPLHFWAGFVCACLLALGVGALIRRGGVGARAGGASLTFVCLNGVWFLQCVLMGYID